MAPINPSYSLRRFFWRATKTIKLEIKFFGNNGFGLTNRKTFPELGQELGQELGLELVLEPWGRIWMVGRERAIRDGMGRRDGIIRGEVTGKFIP